ncbi:MAG: hypothetical protein ABIU96_15535, partial [Rhodanobacter sp.]
IAAASASLVGQPFKLSTTPSRLTISPGSCTSTVACVIDNIYDNDIINRLDHINRMPYYVPMYLTIKE